MTLSSKLILLVCCFILFSISSGVQAQKITLLPTSQWHGFKKVNFLFNDIPAFYIKPTKPLPGNPWIWRAHFPDWHIAMDSVLLQKGMSVVYINTNDQYGAPKAMMVWDEFYNYMTHKLSFAHKVALEGVSRGGLYVYGWAKRNPDKVSCIYAEAPVCDFKSWPGGKGMGEGAPNNWKELQKIYGFTEEQAIDYNDNPINNLDGLAAFKVPILHVISLRDKVVPPAENTFVLVENYMKLGGQASVYPITRGKQELNGHHFIIENSDMWADFILYNSYPVITPLPYQNYFDVRRGLSQFYKKIKSGQPVTVTYLGGSITHNSGWRNKVSQFLQERYPSTSFHFIAAGIPSLGSLPHAFRLQRDVLDSGKIDLMFVEAAVNDRGNDTDSLTQVRDLEGIVRHAKRSNPDMDIILMSFADAANIKDYKEQRIPVEAGNHELVANHYSLPSINLAKQVSDKILAGEFSWEYDFKDLHPSPFGQEIYFQTIKSFINKCFDKADSSHGETGMQHLPAPLDPHNFDQGRYLSINEAQLLKGFKLVDRWHPSDKVSTRQGFVDVPVLEAVTPGAELSLSFKGKTIGLAVLAGPDAGIIEYSIDKKPFQKMDIYTKWSSGLHLPWYKLFAADLQNRKHNLRLRLLNDSNVASKGTACRIVYFLLDE